MGIQSTAKLQARFDVYLMHVYIARTSHLSCVTALFPCLLRQIVDLAIQEWMLSCLDFGDTDTATTDRH